MSTFLSGNLNSSGVSDGVWSSLLTCGRTLLSPYAISLTDIDPGDVAHIEIVVTDSAPETLGLPAQVLGTAGVSCTSFAPRSLDFIFAKTLADDPVGICKQLGFVLGSNAGLSQNNNCADVMSNEAACPTKSFSNSASTCTSAACICGGTEQNTHETMLDAFGATCS